MVDYETDEALAEIHDEMYREEEKRPKSAISKIPQQPKFFIGLTVAAVVLLIVLNKIDVKTGLMILGGVGVALYFMQGTNATRGELSYLECMLRLNDTLKFLQKHPIGDYPQIPKGDVRIKPIGRKQWYEGNPFKRSYAVDIYDSIKDVVEMYFVEVDVFTGDIITFKHSPAGVYGDETKDIKLMPTYDMLIQKKRDEYVGKGYRK